MSKNFIEQGSQTILTLNKLEYINNLRISSDSYANLLNNLKKNFHNYRIKINNKKIVSYLNFLSFLTDNYESFMEIIILITNISSFTKPVELLKKKLDENYHIIYKNSTLSFNITLNFLAKQIFYKTNFILVNINSKSAIESKKILEVSVTYDLINSDPILLKISNLGNYS